jgi:hypothetical protein
MEIVSAKIIAFFDKDNNNTIRQYNSYERKRKSNQLLLTNYPHNTNSTDVELTNTFNTPTISPDTCMEIDCDENSDIDSLQYEMSNMALQYSQKRIRFV